MFTSQLLKAQQDFRSLLMAADFQKIFETIDARLISNQSITPKKLARELNLTVQDIETAIREEIGRASCRERV